MGTTPVMVRTSAIGHAPIIAPFPYHFGTIPHGEPGHVPACMMSYHTDDMSGQHQVIPMANMYGARW